MQHEGACARPCLKAVEDLTRGTSAMDRKDLAACLLARSQNVLEHVKLVGPRGFQFGRSIKSHFAYIAGLRQELVKQWQLALPLACELWVQAEGSPDAAVAQ